MTSDPNDLSDEQQSASATSPASAMSEEQIAQVKHVIEALPPGMQRMVADLVRQGGTIDSAMVRAGRPGIRRESSSRLFGWPLWSVAVGGDPAAGQIRGHARGVLAFGDVATGVVAIGGWARGVIALGGAANGVVALGGLSVGAMAHGGLAVGLLWSFGGLSASTCLAIGGVALGYAAVGGLACGRFAVGAMALGQYCVSPLQRSPEAIAFFKSLAAFDPTGLIEQAIR